MSILDEAAPVNLDGEFPDALWAFWRKYRAPRPQDVKVLFPDGQRWATRTTGKLADYAVSKAKAMETRAKGDIATAQRHERECERIYATLPDAARW